MRQTIAKSFQVPLYTQNLECKVVEIPAITRTAQETTDAISCTLEQITKPLIFKTFVVIHRHLSNKKDIVN